MDSVAPFSNVYEAEQSDTFEKKQSQEENNEKERMYNPQKFPSFKSHFWFYSPYFQFKVEKKKSEVRRSFQSVGRDDDYPTWKINHILPGEVLILSVSIWFPFPRHKTVSDHWVCRHRFILRSQTKKTNRKCGKVIDVIAAGLFLYQSVGITHTIGGLGEMMGRY